MSEAYLSNVITQMIAQVSHLLTQEIRLLFGVEDELDELKNSISKLGAKLVGAEEQQAHNQDIKNFLIQIKDAMYDADDLFDQFYNEALMRKPNRKVCSFFSKSNPLCFRLLMAHRINKLRTVFDKFNAEISEFNIIEHIRDVRDEQIRERETHSFVLEEEVIGRDYEKKKIMGKLFDPDVENNVSVIAIVGIGGFGKTTLAQALYNNTRVKNHFELKMWVCVSEEFDVKTILGKIIESAIGKKPTEIQNLDSLQGQMRREIEGKKYLLVLDDIWNENDEKWMMLEPLLMGGARGSRILITTRSQRVAGIARPVLVFPIKGLSEGNSWLLFKKVAFGKENGDQAKDPNFIKVGREIVKELNGVPLAIRTIGRVLYSKTSHLEWISFKDNELSRIIQGEGSMMSILKISYNNLPTHLKPCFAYCSLFPKDFLIDENELVKQWIAQGFINQSQCQGKSMEDVGHDYLEELYWRSLFQEKQTNIFTQKQKFKIHDLIHDLAQFVSGGEHILLKNSSDLQKIDIRTRHVSFDARFNLKKVISTSIHEAKKLRSLLFQSKVSLNKQVFGMIISCFAHLRVLNLCDLDISVVPETINKLTQLRYLDLSSNGKIKLLPNTITELKSLQTLDLSDCWSLKELPRSTSDLVNLRHLIIEGSDLRHMPEGLSKLTCLQTLSVFVLGKKYGSGLNELNNLSGKLVIKGLGFLRCNKSKARVNCDPNLKESKGLSIELRWRLSVSEINEVGSCGKLVIKGYNGVGLSNWLISLSNLVSITIFDCRRLQCLPQFYQLPLLKYLRLKGLSSLEFIVNISGCSSSTIFFPSLQTLLLSHMPELKKWWMGDPHFFFTHFPALTDLLIQCCNKLDMFNIEEMQWKAFESLRSLRLIGLSGLVSLPDGLQYVSTLQDLRLDCCGNLEALPEWIENLTSLLSLTVEDVRKLKSLPNGIRNLTNLRTLWIGGCYKDLKERCKPETESANGEKPIEVQNLDSLQGQMRRQIEGKKYLLVLDDVWNENDEKWMALEPLLMGGARGSRIVITTRSQRVAEIARPILVFPIKGLSEGDSSLLFKKKLAFGKENGDEANYPNFIEVGKEIVQKLNGVPLAIIVGLNSIIRDHMCN